MTLWQDQPPQTRRQAREQERNAALRQSNQLVHPGEETDEQPTPEVTPVATPYGLPQEAPHHAAPDAAVTPAQSAEIPVVAQPPVSSVPESSAPVSPTPESSVPDSPTPESSAPESPAPIIPAAVDPVEADPTDPQYVPIEPAAAFRPPAPEFEAPEADVSAPESAASLPVSSFDSFDALISADPSNEPAEPRVDAISTLFPTPLAAPGDEEYVPAARQSWTAPVPVERPVAASESSPASPAAAEHDDAHGQADEQATSEQAADEQALYRPAAPAEVPEPVTSPLAVVAQPGGIADPRLDPAAVSAPERTLTRRELRAILQAQEANQHAIEHPGQRIVPLDDDAIEVDEPTNPVSLPVFAPPSSFAPQPTFAPPAGFTPPAKVAPPNAFAPPAPYAAPADAASAAVAPESEKPPYQPPVGHWSTAGAEDEANQPFDQIISRSVVASGAATTTNALILPSVPSAPDATGPLTSTGEILVTGSIDLPRGMGATGQHPDTYDSSDMDRMFDQAESELNTSSVAPIRASRAVSTHTSTRGVITPPKKRGGRMPLILLITASVLALAVVGLLIAGYVLKVL